MKAFEEEYEKLELPADRGIALEVVESTENQDCSGF